MHVLYHFICLSHHYFGPLFFTVLLQFGAVLVLLNDPSLAVRQMASHSILKCFGIRKT